MSSDVPDDEVCAAAAEALWPLADTIACDVEEDVSQWLTFIACKLICAD